MKKRNRIIIPILIVLILVLILVLTMFFFHLIKKVNLDFTEQIIINYQYDEKNYHIQISDKVDFDDLVSICKGTAFNDYSVPSCGFGTVKITFEGNGKKVIIYPACDTCNTMRLGKDNKYFYNISEENRRKLEKILLKYGITFPCI